MPTSIPITAANGSIVYSVSISSSDADDVPYGISRVTANRQLLVNKDEGTRMFSCVLYPTNCNHSEIIYIGRDPKHYEFTKPSGEPIVWAEDLNLDEEFPVGANGLKIIHAPGTTYSLRNEYMMFVSADLLSSPPNRSIKKLFARKWLGNIVVVKLGRRDSMSVVNMSWGERAKVDDVIGSWLHEYFNRCGDAHENDRFT